MKQFLLILCLLPFYTYGNTDFLQIKYDENIVLSLKNHKAEDLKNWINWMYWPRMEDARDDLDVAFVEHYREVKKRVGERRTKFLIYRTLKKILKENPKIERVQDLTRLWYGEANKYPHYENWAIRLGPHYTFLGRRCFLTPECPRI